MQGSYKMIKKEDVLRILEAKGPMIPIHMKKELGVGDTIIIGAVLSELAEAGKVKVSNTKVGGSPAYYIPGTEERLISLMRCLNEKDKRAAELLQQKKILRDSDETPLMRVSLRNIKDFAKPLEVSIKGVKDIYWKWFLISAQEAEEMISKELKPVKKEVLKVAEKSEEKKQAEKQEEKKDDASENKEKKPRKPRKPREKKEKELLREPEESTVFEEKKPSEPLQTELVKEEPDLDKEKDLLFKSVREYFRVNEIQILGYKIIKKGEIDLFINVPSKIGSQEYYCKARDKKKINDGDLSSTYLQGQGSKLPILFLTTGELTKKAKSMLEKEFKGMTVKSI